MYAWVLPIPHTRHKNVSLSPEITCPVVPLCLRSKFRRGLGWWIARRIRDTTGAAAWNHGTDTSPTLVNAIERYSPLDYPRLYILPTQFCLAKARVEFWRCRRPDWAAKQSGRGKTNKIIHQLITEFAREKQRSVFVRVKFGVVRRGLQSQV